MTDIQKAIDYFIRERDTMSERLSYTDTLKETSRDYDTQYAIYDLAIKALKVYQEPQFDKAKLLKWLERVEEENYDCDYEGSIILTRILREAINNGEFEKGKEE